MTLLFGPNQFPLVIRHGTARLRGVLAGSSSHDEEPDAAVATVG